MNEAKTRNNTTVMSKAELRAAIAQLRHEISFGGSSLAKTRRVAKLEKALSKLVSGSVRRRILSGGALGLKK